MRRTPPHRLAAGLLLLAACPAVDSTLEREPGPSGSRPAQDEAAPTTDQVQPPLRAEAAPGPSPRLSGAPQGGSLLAAVAGYFEHRGLKRIYVQVDKPLYKPGETIWVKTWDLRSKDLGAREPEGAIRYQLVSPKGATVLEKLVQEQKGVASNDLELPEGVQGGEYLVRAVAADGTLADRPVVVSTYEPPRLKKKLEFVRKAYGAGDEVTATFKLERPTGEPLARHPLTGLVMLDGEALPEVKVETNAEGGALFRFKLPGRIERGDGLFTVLVDDGGVTESISKRIPILMKKLDFAFFPEGGALVAGLPGRLYFEAKNTIGKPADVAGRILDDRGNVVAEFSTHHAGLGRIELTPNTGRRYSAQITRPAGISEAYPLPLAAETGCVLRSFDDLDGELPELRVSVRCSEARKVIVLATMRESVLDEAFVEVPGDAPAVVYLKAADPAESKLQGVARVTVFDEARQPLAERLVYRNRRQRLNVELSLDKGEYSPREQVALTVKTSHADGQPVAAELALSVVDDTVISFADDKTGHMLTQLYLERELPDKVEEPNFFFDLTKAKSALAMDLLMGTRGWRRFDWTAVLSPPMPSGTVEGRGQAAAAGVAQPPAAPVLRPVPEPMPRPAEPAKPMAARPGRAPAQPVLPAAPPPPPPPPMEAPVMDRRREARAMGERAQRELAADDEEPQAEEAEMKADKDWAGAAGKKQVMGWAPVRVFPAPIYRGDETGPRTDFRETIHWAPSVFTGKDGRAVVTFFLSDGVTSFRVFAEGLSQGVAGRAEKVLKSSLPFNMSVKLPLEVTANDRFLLPLTLSNEKDKAVEVALEASFGPLVKLEAGAETQSSGDAMLTGQASLKTRLGPRERKSIYYPLTVGSQAGKSPIRVFANAGGLTDEFVRELVVVPLGFPQVASASGNLADRTAHEFDLGQAIAGSAALTVKAYPSPVASLISGLDGMLREPSGCFEQTSSTNYPNIMVLNYLKSHDVADPALVERTSGLLDRGYKRLVGFETPNKGYEWFGQSPPHEALSAYGLLEFADMKKVYGEVDEGMVARTAAWLRGRRDGKGGFLRDPKALDSFGGAKPEVTDAYIVYALTEAGLEDLGPELTNQARTAASTADAYLLALAANSLLNVPAKKAEARAAVERLASMQTEGGSWRGADHSITRSTGINLEIETTALAMLALLEAGGHEERVRRAVEWLGKNRGGFGQWGATQATVLALKAMTEYAVATRRTPAPGAITLRVNGQNVGTMKYEAGRREPMELTAPASAFRPGKNTVELLHDGQPGLPYSLALEYRTVRPASSQASVVDLNTALEQPSTTMGKNVRLTVRVKNRTAQGQPMTLARVGLPGGLTFQTWQLKELKDKGLVAFTETRAREVILYFRDLGPAEEKVVPLDLVALIPGEYEGPASSAYLYYSDDAKTWVDGQKISIGR